MRVGMRPREMCRQFPFRQSELRQLGLARSIKQGLMCRIPGGPEKIKMSDMHADK